jgi:Cof subfamily protein (haloacid dehalogenase superfamily)
MNKYKLLALDLDGTLLNCREVISDTNLRFIRKASQDGIRIIITTGRSYSSAYRYIQTVNVPDPSITYNGAVIYNGERVLRTMTLEQGLINGVLQELISMEQAPVVYTLDEKRYYKNLSAQTKTFFEFSKGAQRETVHVDNLLEQEWEQVIRISVITDEDNLKLLDQEFGKKFGRRVKTVQTFFPDWDFWIFEILDYKCSKADGLNFICSRYGIRRNEVIAIGDNRNDIEMITWAGLGVAMKNSLPDVIKWADYITEKSNNENGVAEVIERYIFSSPRL